MKSKNNELILFVGDTDEQLAITALAYDKNASLLTQNNFVEIQHGVYYTSIADLGDKLNLYKVLSKSSKIFYCPPKKWTSEIMEKYTIEYLTEFSYYKTVFNFKRPDLSKIHSEMLSLKDYRKTNKKQIWIAGCSVSDGWQVSKTERYGHLIHKALELPVSFLTQPNSSIQWAADQILRSNIIKDDIIFWGITSLGRTQCWDEDKNNLEHININSYKHNKYAYNFFDKKYLYSETNHYHALIAIHQVVNYCKAVKATLVPGIIIQGIDRWYEIPNCIDFTSLFNRVDCTADGKHPGAQTHKLYAEFFLEKYKSLL